MQLGRAFLPSFDWDFFHTHALNTSILIDFAWLLYERPGDPKFPVPFSKDPTFASAQATMSTSRALSMGTRFSTCQCTQMPDSHACNLRFLVCFSVPFYFLRHSDLTRTAIFSELPRTCPKTFPFPELTWNLLRNLPRTCVQLTQSLRLTETP